MKKLFPLLAFLLIISTAFAGSNTAVLTCKSESGKTLFKIYLRDVHGALEKGEFSIEGHALNLAKADKRLVIHPKEGVFTLYIDNMKNEGRYDDHLEFWAIPATFKIVRDEHLNKLYEFEAYIKGSDPRPGRETSPKIKLICTFEYNV